MTVEQKAAEEYVNFLSDAMTPKTETRDEVKQGTIEQMTYSNGSDCNKGDLLGELQK